VSPTEPNRTLAVIGYGSLLSGYGLLAERRGGQSRLLALDAEPVTVANARRGLAKPSSHGRYLAMDIEPRDRSAPITARAGLARGAGDGFGALLLTFDREFAALIARREEYDPAAFERLVALADRAGASLGEFLLTTARAANFEPLAYRSALCETVGYTSPGYIFHPVPLDDGRIAIVAIGSGYEGSGDPAVLSRRREFGIDRLHGIASALALAGFDRAGQIGYFAECVLGGIHGLAVADLLADFDPAAPWVHELAARVRDEAAGEAERFLRATSLDERRYRARFGAPDAGLTPLLKLAGLL
jgi:hypothetical protein